MGVRERVEIRVRVHHGDECKYLVSGEENSATTFVGGGFEICSYACDWARVFAVNSLRQLRRKIGR